MNSNTNYFLESFPTPKELLDNPKKYTPTPHSTFAKTNRFPPEVENYIDTHPATRMYVMGTF